MPSIWNYISVLEFPKLVKRSFVSNALFLSTCVLLYSDVTNVWVTQQRHQLMFTHCLLVRDPITYFTYCVNRLNSLPKIYVRTAQLPDIPTMHARDS